MNGVARSTGISLLTDARITISLKTSIKIQPDALICDLKIEQTCQIDMLGCQPSYCGEWALNGMWDCGMNRQNIPLGFSQHI